MKPGFQRRVQTCWKSIAEHEPASASIGVILGSGLQGFGDSVPGVTIPFSAIKGFPESTVDGHRGLLRLGHKLVVCMGRFHFYEGHSLDDVVLPVFLLYKLGVRTLVVTNAAGAVNEAYAPGDLVLIRDHINLIGNPLRGPNPIRGVARFTDMSSAYPVKMRAVACSVAPDLREGVYAALSGPSYETPAEIRMLRQLGADMVGMSTVPEVIAAVYLGMQVLGISCITNMAAGILAEPLTHSEVLATGKRVAPRFVAMLQDVLAELEREHVGAG